MLLHRLSYLSGLLLTLACVSIALSADPLGEDDIPFEIDVSKLEDELIGHTVEDKLFLQHFLSKWKPAATIVDPDSTTTLVVESTTAATTSSTSTTVPTTTTTVSTTTAAATTAETTTSKATTTTPAKGTNENETAATIYLTASSPSTQQSSIKELNSLYPFAVNPQSFFPYPGVGAFRPPPFGYYPLSPYSVFPQMTMVPVPSAPQFPSFANYPSFYPSTQFAGPIYNPYGLFKK